MDIGLNGFSSANGIEIIEAAPGTGTVRLLGGWSGERFDFSGVTLAGSNFRIETGGGNDTVIGSAGDDSINAGSEQDQLIGGLGADQLTGGSSCDTFIFNSIAEIGLEAGKHDVITDFVSLVDKIDLVNIDANSDLTGDQAFVYVGAAAFSGVAGELRLIDQVLSGDINGDAQADFRLGLAGVLTLSASADLRL